MAHLDNPLLIHVAAESENRGRVVLAARSGAPHAVAVGAALSVAKAFDAWLECLLIECPEVVALTAYGFAREVTHAGRIVPLSLAQISENQSCSTAQARKVITAAAVAADVRITTEVARENLGPALARTCAAYGPWNIVALAEPIQARDGDWLHGLLESVSGATGIVVVGPNAQASSGDVIIVVEDVERLPQMIRAADRLLGAPGEVLRRISLLLAGASSNDKQELDGLVRLLVPDLDGTTQHTIEIVDAGIAHGTHGEVAEALRRLAGGFVIARSGGLVVPADGDIGPLTTVLNCPLLLVR